MKIFKLSSLLLLLLFSIISIACRSKTGNRLSRTIGPDSTKYIGTVAAPEFPKNMQWLNTSHNRPISLKELRGKVVLLDFWTYGCINCYHILPSLEKLKKDFGTALVIIGVQSAKFKSSGKVQNFKQAVLRWGIEHPTVNDKNFKIWKKYGIRAWPTLVLIDPAGKIVTKRAGEGIYKPMHRYISGVIKTFSKAGKIDRTPLNFTPASDKIAQSLLSFPGKLRADAAHNRLFIADTNHNRIVISTLDGKVKIVIGNGKAALKDGSYQEASFNQPQGMTRMGNKLYVADTGNNAVRVINLKKKTVSTLAGNGKQARRFNVSGVGRDVRLNSPWDITHVNGKLYVAMAGSHQIWTVDPKTGYAQPFAGTGREGLKEGNRNSIPMAQPSGITTNGRYLYVTQPEASAVQRIGLGNNKKVKIIVGKGLFVFGDKNGIGQHAQLQHDLGIAYRNGNLFVADTYNNKIKKIDLKTGRVSTFAGSGESGYKDGVGQKAEFDEPGGLSIAGNWLYVADSNNDLIRKINLKTRKVETLQFTNLAKMKLTEKTDHPEKIVKLPVHSISADADQVSFSLTVPDPYHFNRRGPNQFIVYFGRPTMSFSGQKQAALTFPKGTKFPLTTSISLNGKHPKTLYVDVYAYFCRDGRDVLCRYNSYRYKIPLKYSKNGKQKIKINQKLRVPSLSGS